MAKSILKKYEDIPCDKALPVISNQKYNQYLKDIGRAAGLDDPMTIVNYSGNKRIKTTPPKWSLLTTHVARKTFVTLGVYLNIPIELMIEFTGHTLDIVRRYYTISNQQKTKEMTKYNSILKVVS